MLVTDDFELPPILFLFLRDGKKSLISSFIILFNLLLFILSCYLFHHFFTISFTIFLLFIFITYLISVYFVWKVSRKKKEIPKQRIFMFRLCILISNVREKPNVNMNVFCENDKSIYFEFSAKTRSHLN